MPIRTFITVDVVADPLGAFLSAKPTHVDYMSMVTAAHAIGLLNLSISNGEEKIDDLYYGFIERSIPMTEPDKLVVFNPKEINEYLRNITEISDKDLFSLLNSMKDT